MVSTQNQMNPVHTFPSYFFNIQSNVIFPTTSRVSKWPQNASSCSLLHLRPAHNIWAELENKNIYMKYKSQVSSLRNVLHSHLVHPLAELGNEMFTIDSKYASLRSRTRSLWSRFNTEITKWYASEILRAGIGYGPDDRSSIPTMVWNFFLFATESGQALGPTQPPNQWVPGRLSAGGARSWPLSSI
jgi:hypothetical protein